MSMKDQRHGFGWLQPNLQGYIFAGSTLGAHFFFSFSFLLFTILTADERENLYCSIQRNAGSKERETGEWLLNN